VIPRVSRSSRSSVAWGPIRQGPWPRERCSGGNRRDRCRGGNRNNRNRRSGRSTRDGCRGLRMCTRCRPVEKSRIRAREVWKGSIYSWSRRERLPRLTRRNLISASGGLTSRMGQTVTSTVTGALAIDVFLAVVRFLVGQVIVPESWWGGAEGVKP
jgi:hypothetical protein